MLLNSYGDTSVKNGGHGCDIASQRLDDLDKRCLSASRSMVKSTVIELGAGRCGLSNRLSREEANVTAVDLRDFSQEAALRVKFVQADAIEFMKSVRSSSIDIIVSQRTLHYYPHSKAITLLKNICRALKANGFLFISASGLNSELSGGYIGKNIPIPNRHSNLSVQMAEKHNIIEPVTLWTEDELKASIIESGLGIEKIYSSEFGNVKVIARKINR
jgi:SAM-dependent methyltransferase